MASENVKIIIQEADETTPKGSGTSSDVAYIPGLAVADAKSKNVPVLCNTVSDLEASFGAEPYTMTARDVTDVGIEHTYKVGDYDKSYLYAKELLNAGMSVIYENITAENAVQNIATVTYSKNVGTSITGGTNNEFQYAVTKTSGTVTPEFKFKIVGNGAAGQATVILEKNYINSELSMQLVNVTSSFTNAEDGSKAVTCTASGKNSDKYVIEWKGLENEDLEYTVFTATLSFNYKGEIADTCDFALYVVDGKNTTVNGDVVAASKIRYLYDHLGDCLDNIEDKNEYSVKYITTGGYPAFVKIPQADGTTAYSLANAVIDCAYQRGDAVALIDPIDDPDDPLRYNDENSIYAAANDYFANAANASFGAMFMPWGTYTCVTVKDITKMSNSMPASFGYLMCMANAIKTSPNWLAMAGVARGSVPNLTKLNTNKILSNVIAEDYQPKYGSDENKISINAITNIKPYGLTLWGNRTLEPVAEKGTVALNFLNTRNMVSDIKKLAYSTAKSLMFEQDSDTLWLRFKSGVSPLLEQLKSGHGISDYKLLKGTTKYNGKALTRGEMAAVIKIYPLYAVEYFEITVVVADNDVEVE